MSDHFDKLVADAVKRNAAKRDAQARALWRDAETPELRAHLRMIYPDLFERAPNPSPRRELVAPPLPDGLFDWPPDKRKEWYAEVRRLCAAERRS